MPVRRERRRDRCPGSGDLRGNLRVTHDKCLPVRRWGERQQKEWNKENDRTTQAASAGGQMNTKKNPARDHSEAHRKVERRLVPRGWTAKIGDCRPERHATRDRPL